MALVASCGVLRIVLRQYRPDRLAKMRFRRSLYLLQRRRMWATVCRLSPQLHVGLVTVGTPRLKRKSLSPIFSVRSCTSSALFRLLSLSRSCSAFLVGAGVSVGRAAFLVFSPCAYPCPLCLHLTPSSERCSEWVQLGRCVCWLLSAAVFSPSGGLLGGLVSGLVSWDAHMGWYPFDCHVSSLVLEPLDLSRDLLEDAGA
jgi:hypothetical protein